MQQTTFIKRIKKDYKKDFFDNSNSLLLLYDDRSKQIIVAHFAKVYVYKK